MSLCGNLFGKITDASFKEQFKTLIKRDGLRIERIISRGQITPQGEWYDQSWNEWVLLLKGEALIRIENECEPHRLSAGDWIMLPRHCRHRVDWTIPDQETIWLALHWAEQGADSGLLS